MRMITPRGRRVRGTVGSPRWPPAGRSGRGEYRIKAGHLKTTIRNGTAATGAINNTAHRRVKNKESGGKKGTPKIRSFFASSDVFPKVVPSTADL